MEASNSAVRIRRARRKEAELLSELAHRAKAVWGYDEAFMRACRDELTLSPDDLVRDHVFVLEADGAVVGFYRLCGAGQTALLSDLFVAPEMIGRGYGKRLWRHATQTAQQLGFHRIEIHSDPHAEGFYLAMGAERGGEVVSTVFTGRRLPRLICWLTPTRDGRSPEKGDFAALS